jgi:phage shock protein E
MNKKRKRTIFTPILAGMTLFGFLFFIGKAVELTPFTDITPEQAAALIQEKGSSPLFAILDVRTAEEFAQGHLKDSLNIDFYESDFRQKIEKLKKNGIYLVYCRGGVRSASAINRMKEWGFEQAFNLAGGLLRWQKESFALESESPKSMIVKPNTHFHKSFPFGRSGFQVHDSQPVEFVPLRIFMGSPMDEASWFQLP